MAKKRLPKIVGYSLAGFLAGLLVMGSVWMISFFYEVFFIPTSEMYITLQAFLRGVYLILYIVLAFTAFCPLVYLILTLVSKLKRFRKLRKQREKITAYLSLGYWTLFVLSMMTYSILFLFK